MKKILLTLLMGGFCCLMATGGGYPGVGYDDGDGDDDGVGVGGGATASASGHVNVVAADEVVARNLQAEEDRASAVVHAVPASDLPIRIDGTSFSYRGGEFPEYHEYAKWFHDLKAKESSCDDTGFIMFGRTKIVTSPSHPCHIPHLDKQPASPQPGDLWTETVELIHRMQHHTFTGENWKREREYEIYKYDYVVTLLKLYRLDSGMKTEIAGAISNAGALRRVEGRIGGKKFTNTNYSGQGSNGEVPIDVDVKSRCRIHFAETFTLYPLL